MSKPRHRVITSLAEETGDDSVAAGLGILSGALSIALGALLLARSELLGLRDGSEGSSGALLVVGLGAILGGLVVLGVARWTLREGKSSRAGLALIFGLNLSVGLWAFQVLPGERRLIGVFAMAIGVFVLYMLVLDVLLADHEGDTGRTPPAQSRRTEIAANTQTTRAHIHATRRQGGDN